MAELKTKPNDASVESFLEAIPDESRRQECRTILAMMKKATGCAPKMWGKDMVGFGSYRYRYPSGHEGEWFLVGFSPRKQNLSLHLMAGVEPFPKLMAKLGKHKTGKACVYVNRLADVDLKVLEELVVASVERTRRQGAGSA